MDNAAQGFAIGGMMIFILVLALAFHLFFGYCFKRIAEKAGNDDTGIWWIPLANYLLVLRAAGKPAWWLILLLIPFVNIITMFIVWIEVSRNLGHGTAWGVIAVLVSIIGIPYLAFANEPSPAIA